MEPQLDLALQARHWVRRDKPGPHRLMCAMADEIERLRGYRDEAESDAAVARLLVDRLRLTDAEREAIEMAYSRLTAEAKYTAVAATLRGLLDRIDATGSGERHGTAD